MDNLSFDYEDVCDGFQELDEEGNETLLADSGDEDEDAWDDAWDEDEDEGDGWEDEGEEPDLCDLMEY